MTITEKQPSEILSLRDKAKDQLLEIRTVEDGISYLNKLKAIDIWVKAEKKDAELQNLVAEQKLRTQRILGELIQENQRKGLLAVSKDSLKNGSVVKGGDHGKNNLSDIGLTKQQSHTFQTIANIPQDDFEEFIQEKKQAVDNAVSELTTSGAMRLAKSLQSNGQESGPKLVHEITLSEYEILEEANYINSNYTSEQKQFLISLIKD